MKPRTVTVILAVLFLGLALLGCNRKPTDPTGPTPINISITNTQNQGSQNQGTASPSPGPQCAAVVRVGVVATLPTGPEHVTAWEVGQSVRLDATAQGIEGPAPSNCVGGSVQWSLSGTATCALSGDVNGFIPNLSCIGAGSITACAAVAPPGGTGCGQFTVNP